MKKREKFHLRMREKNVEKVSNFTFHRGKEVKKREKFHLRMREKKCGKSVRTGKISSSMEVKIWVEKILYI